jgi:valyl-tRNA synthetase
VIEPQAVLENYGADALRFCAAGSKLGEDLDYQEKELVAGKKFVTKIWNAAKFISGSLNNKKPKKIEETDRLFLAELNRIIDSATKSFEN